MTRIQLRIETQPTEVVLFCATKRTDQALERLAAVIDTGAEVSLVPDTLLDEIVHRRTGRGKFVVEQAGIAKQEFEAM